MPVAGPLTHRSHGLPIVFRITLPDRRTGKPSRREWLSWGSGTLASCAATASLWGGPPTRLGKGPATRDARPGFGRAKSVVLLYASGGQSQFETWDPKPHAPEQVRGEFRPTSTRVPGLQICEHLPKTAAIADRLTVIRNMSHADLDHGSATYLALTGHYHPRRSSNPDPTPQDYPTHGSVVQRLAGEKRSVYDAVHVNGPAQVPIRLAPGQNAGFLGRPFEPLLIGNPIEQTDAVPGMRPQPQWHTLRLDDRLKLKQQLDGFRGQLEAMPNVSASRQDYQQALNLLSEPSFRHAFELGREPEALKQRYGRNRAGQATLLARRLVEAGIPYICVMLNHSNRGQDQSPDWADSYGWDTHNDIFGAMKRVLLPNFDQTFSTFILDLEARGLLESTLVICLGEFGRAPKVAFEQGFAGSHPGRKHWSWGYSIVMAGAGIGQGAVVGATDRLGAEPTGDRYGPWDVAATIHWALGQPPERIYRDALGRPFRVAEGRPMLEAFG